MREPLYSQNQFQFGFAVQTVDVNAPLAGLLIYVPSWNNVRFGYDQNHSAEV